MMQTHHYVEYAEK